MSNFYFSNRSLKELEGVNKNLVRVANRAIKLSSVDFGISEGLRSIEEQEVLFAAGASQTLKSKHLKGKAIDVFAYVEGKARWEPCFYYKICEAFKLAAIEEGVSIRWGGAWHIHNITKLTVSPEEASEGYVSLRKSQGRKPFLDYVHFELS